jgi:hypothetical protein
VFGVRRLRALVADFRTFHSAFDDFAERSEREASGLATSVADLREAVDRQRVDLERALEALQLVRDDEPRSRKRLDELRRSDAYEAAYSDPEPLVSVVIPTYTSYETLRDRAIPSVIAQTYPNWEIVVVGDAAPQETADVVASFGDPRIRFQNLAVRGPYPEDPHLAWLVTAAPPFNAGLLAARGRWIAPLGDDDALRSQALERMLHEVRARRLELGYAQQNYVHRDGREEVFGEFPPRLHRVGMQGALLHAGLRFFGQEIGDAVFQLPADWGWFRRMLRVGVRIGFVEEVLADYYPSYRGDPVTES